jgi:hypothetical protein
VVKGSTPSFKRLSSKLTSEALRQHAAYADFWGYSHVLWEATANAHILGRSVAALCSIQGDQSHVELNLRAHSDW